MSVALNDPPEHESSFPSTVRDYLRGAALGMEISEYGTPFLPDKPVLNHAVEVLRRQLLTALPSRDLLTVIIFRKEDPISNCTPRVELRVWHNGADQVQEVATSSHIERSDFCLYRYAQALLRCKGEADGDHEIERRFAAWQSQQQSRLYVLPYIVRMIEDNEIKTAKADPNSYLVAANNRWERLLYTRPAQVGDGLPDEWPSHRCVGADGQELIAYYTCGILLAVRNTDAPLSTEDMLHLEAISIQFQLSWSWAHIAATSQKQKETERKQRDVELEQTTRKAAFEMLKDIAKDLRNLERTTSKVKGIVYPLEGELLTRYRRPGDLIAPDYSIPFYGWQFRHRWNSEAMIRDGWDTYRAQFSCLLLHFLDEARLPTHKDEPWCLKKQPWEILADIAQPVRDVHPYLEATIGWVTKGQLPWEARPAVWSFEFLRGCFYDPFKGRPGNLEYIDQATDLSRDEEGVWRLTGALLLMWAFRRGFTPEERVRTKLFRATKRDGWVRLEVLPALDSLIEDILADGVNPDGTDRPGNKELHVTMEDDAAGATWMMLRKLTPGFLGTVDKLLNSDGGVGSGESFRLGSLEAQIATLARLSTIDFVDGDSLQICLGKPPEEGAER